MKFLNKKKGFLGYEASYNVKDKVIVIPFGLEKTVSYGRGTQKGPDAIIKASHQVELYDEELEIEPYKKIGIKTLKPFKIKKSLNAALKQISEINSKIIYNNKFPLVLGGEHSLTPGAIRPFAKKFKELVIVHFDAHADLRQEYNGDINSHACAIKRCLDHKNIKVVSLGIRNLSEEEMKFYKKNKKRISIFWAKDKAKWNLKSLSNLIYRKNVYITFDVDSLDSSIMPATGTPEPGGLFWDETMKMLKLICKNSKVVGADINELSPIKYFDSYNFLVAKLSYKLLSYVFEFKRY